MRKLLTICAIFLLTNMSVCHVQASTGNYTEQNATTGYHVVIEDSADLLTEEKEADLAVVMGDITAYGNAAFKTIDENDSSTESYAESYYKSLFGTESGTLFLIDMDNRNIWIHSDGAVYKVITKSYANTITDNVYRDASVGDYYECGAEAFRQIFTLLEGDRIAQPMKYISNILLAIILSLLINFGLVAYFTKVKKTKEEEILEMIEKRFMSTNPEAVFTHETRVYDPVSSDSGGSSSGGSSDSSSGGGGGHSF